jgi:opacity protein-like surface antigen
MRSPRSSIAIAAGAVVALGLSCAPAFAQDDSQAPAAVTPYGSVGYAFGKTGDALHDADTDAVTARVGARFGRYWGVEAEGDIGTRSETDNATKSQLQHSYAGYLVGWLPITRKLSLFARAGLGANRFKFDVAGVHTDRNAQSVNWGVGGEYRLTEKNGVRVEYLQEDYSDSLGVSSRVIMSFVRRF